MNKKKRKGRVSPSVSCEQATNLILDYLSGELDRRTALELEKHLIQCPDCVSFLTTYKETLRAARSLRWDDIPGEMQRRVEEFLRRKTKEARSNQ